MTALRAVRAVPSQAREMPRHIHFLRQSGYFGHITQVRALQDGPSKKGDDDYEQVFSPDRPRFDLMVGAGTTVEVMTPSALSAAACVNANC